MSITTTIINFINTVTNQPKYCLFNSKVKSLLPFCKQFGDEVPLLSFCDQQIWKDA